MTWSRRTDLPIIIEVDEEEVLDPEEAVEPTREVAPINRRVSPTKMTDKAADPDSLKRTNPTSSDGIETETSFSEPRRLEEPFKRTEIAMTDDQR